MGDKNKGKHHIDRLYKCRDMEIRNLWQRSIFLATFLVLCYTAYGALIGNMLEICYLNSDRICRYNIAAILLSFVGIIMSILWICMAKGSKAWQEVYEDAIDKYEELYYPKGFHSNELSGRRSKRDRCLFSVKGGPFSPSKINIVIGQISLILWSLIALWHFAHLLWYNLKSMETFSWILIGIALVLTISIILRLCHDPYIKDRNEVDKKEDTAKSKSVWFNVVSEHLSKPDNNAQNNGESRKA